MILLAQACVAALITASIGWWIGAFAFSVVAVMTMGACLILLIEGLRMRLALVPSCEAEPPLAWEIGSVLLSSAGMGLIWPAVPAILLWTALMAPPHEP
jgi:hypothetical protein